MNAARRPSWRSAALLGLLALNWGRAAVAGEPPARELELVGCARQLVAGTGDALWPGLAAAPFSILLVTGEHEYLLCATPPVADFVPLRRDGASGCEVLVRPRRMAADLLATFPAFSAEPTIVVGTMTATGKSATGWLLALVHEHFHQLQLATRGYFDGVEALGLDGGDKSGQWMLDYPFPYGDHRVGERFADFARTLGESLRASGTPTLADSRRAVERAAQALRSSLGPADARYLAFQLWQEGVARYIELRAAEAAVRAAPDCPAGLGLDFSAAAASLRRDLDAALAEPDALATQRRLSFYPVGAALALVLDAADPGWRASYAAEPFHLAGGPAP